MLKKMILPLGILLCAVSGMAVQAGHSDKKSRDLAIVTGPKTGTYIAWGNDIATVAKSSGLQLTVKESGGSIDNIKRITSDENAALGVVQSDVLGFLARAKNDESRRIANELRMVLPLGKEEVHVLARKEIAGFADLQGKRVVVGEDGSGNMLTAVNLMAMMGVTPEKTLKLSPPEGVVAVLQNEADAMIFVGGKPVRVFKNLEDLKTSSGGANASLLEGVHFLPLSDPKMLKEYATAEINAQDYGFVAQAVPTLAVTAVLVSYDFSSPINDYYKSRCRDLKLLSKAIRGNIGYLRANGHPKWKEVELDSNVGIWKRDLCSWHEEAAAAAPDGGKAPVKALQKDLLKVIESNK